MFKYHQLLGLLLKMVSKKVIIVMFVIALVLLAGSLLISSSERTTGGRAVYEEFIEGDNDGNVRIVISPKGGNDG